MALAPTPCPARRTALSPPSCLTDALTVYCVPTATFAGLDDHLHQLLTPAEQQRAARYVRPADRRRFRVGRAALRCLLGQRLGLAPAAVPLRLSPLGKPELAAPAGLHFNVAHSGEWVLIALAAKPVGIDVEEQDPALDFAAVAAARFGPADQQCLAQSPQPVTTFYQLWTQLEARAKATGLGLSTETGPDPAAWTVRNFGVAPGYAAALAYPAGWQPVIQFRRLDASCFFEMAGLSARN